MKVKSHSVVFSSATSKTVQSMEFSRPKYWSGWPFPSLGNLPNSGIEPRSPALQVDSLLSLASREAQEYWSGYYSSPVALPHLGIKPGSPALQVGSLPTEL